MTIALIVLGSAAAGLGTRLAAVAFVGAAIAGTQQTTLAAVATWTSATAAGRLLLSRDSPRRIALPGLGLAAVLAAGASANAATLLGLWVVATAAAVLSRSTGRSAERWALALCGSDVLLVAAVASSVGRGFEGWPGALRTAGAAALVASAALRAILAAGPDDATPMPGLLIVRAQFAVLAVLAVGAGGVGLSEAAVVVGTGAFAAAPLLPRSTVTDVVQELALVLVAVASPEAGWGPAGWVWGALGAGTLIHHLRFTVGRTRMAPFAAALSTSAGIGLPFLPVVLAELEGATAAPRWVATAVLAGLLAGLAGRARMHVATGRRTATSADELRSLVVVVLAAVASVCAAVFVLPQPAAATAVGAPPLWAGAAILVAAAVGARMQRLTTPGRRPVLQITWPRAVSTRVDVLDRWMTERVVWGALGLLAAAATAMWIVGISRGFL